MGAPRQKTRGTSAASFRVSRVCARSLQTGPVCRLRIHARGRPPGLRPRRGRNAESVERCECVHRGTQISRPQTGVLSPQTPFSAPAVRWASET
jgi:hypothetical protein